MERLEALADSLVADVKAYVARMLQPVLNRIKAIEDWRAAVPSDLKGEKGDPGRDAPAVDVESLRPMLEVKFAQWELEFDRHSNEFLQRTVDRLPRPKNGEPGRDGVDGADGKDADSEAITSVVLEKVMKAMDEIPLPKDGAPGLDGSGVSCGDGPPMTAGKDGDIYIDIKTGDVYQCA